MKKIVLVAAAFSLAAGTAFASGDTESRVQASRMAVKEFFGQLKGQLVSAIKAGGPVNAISVCNQSAPAIAHEVSDKKGFKIGRTSLKLRSPANAPDAWEREVLEAFELRKARGEDPNAMETWAAVEMDGKKVFRYMKAIPTAEKPCLACHGGKVPPAVATALGEHYPHDKARGYKAGDIRGAFTIIQPMD